MTASTSDLPVSPGSVLSEELRARGLTQKRLAEVMGCTQQAISFLARGRWRITAPWAERLERALGISAEFWLNLEVLYRQALVKQRSIDTANELPNCARCGAAATSFVEVVQASIAVGTRYTCLMGHVWTVYLDGRETELAERRQPAWRNRRSSS